MTPSLRSRLAQLLATHSLRIGEFTLSSGEISDVYLDVKSTSLTGEGAHLIGRLLWELASGLSPAPAAIGGLTLGADPLVTAVSLAAYDKGESLHAVIVRKETKAHGTQRFLECPPALDGGDSIVAVDDVITTGGSTITAIERMRDAGFIVDHAICVVDRQAGGREALANLNVELHALFTLDELREA